MTSQAQDLPLEHEALLLFLYAAPVGMVQTRLDGSIELINGAAAKLLLPQAPEAQLANLYRVLSRMAPDLRTRVGQFHDHHGTVCDGLRLATAAGQHSPVTPQWLSLTLVKVGPDRLLATLSDITQQVRNEQALHDSQARLRFTLASAQIGDWELHLASGLMQRTLQHDRCFGYQQLQPGWRFQTFVDHVHAQDRAAVLHLFHQAVATRQDWRVECRVLWPDASVHWLRLHGTFEAGDAAPTRMLGIVSDITAQRQAEQDRLDAQRLQVENTQIQAASQLKNQFLANMSHELRTPLNAVIGFADLLKAGAIPADSPRHQQFLGHIGTSGRHLLQLINDVLDLAKVESGTFSFHPEPLHLPSLVQGVVDVLQPALMAKQLQVSVQVASEVADLVLDAARLKQVLYNYLSNAIKFTGVGGQVRVCALAEGPRQVRLEVHDTGMGIAAHDLPRLFNDFQQLDGGHARAHQGTGLGLSLTRKLVQAQGGSVGVRSTPGVGSVFHLVLDRVHQPPAVPSPPSAPASETAGTAQRLLLIDGDAPGQGQRVQHLAQALDGVAVDAASTGAHALQLAGQHRYGAISLDLLLPDQPGLGVLAGIRGDGPSRESPVVALNMPSMPGNTAHFAISDVLSKPIRTDEVASAVQRLRRPAPQRTRVLVVDDERAALTLMEAVLGPLDIDVRTLQDGREAINSLDQLRPDLIILDLMMPGFDGFAVLDALSRLPAWCHTPVLVWTSMILTDDEYTQLGRTAHEVLGKGGGALALLLDSLRRGLPISQPAS